MIENRVQKALRLSRAGTSRHQSVLGLVTVLRVEALKSLELVRVAPGLACSRLRVAPEHLQQDGYAHAGSDTNSYPNYEGYF